MHNYHYGNRGLSPVAAKAREEKLEAEIAEIQQRFVKAKSWQSLSTPKDEESMIVPQEADLVLENQYAFPLQQGMLDGCPFTKKQIALSLTVQSTLCNAHVSKAHRTTMILNASSLCF